MSGLLALLDDVASIAKVAAASVDDVASQAIKASTKTAGALIDDAAVSPKYVQGFTADRELPIVWKITKGSLRNKLVILLPIALLLSYFAPGVIHPLLMLGGAYLTYEGAEKIWHALRPSHDHEEAAEMPAGGPHLEEKKVKGAIKTDFILSAEIMTITLSALPEEKSIWVQAGALALAGVLITIAVYGAVALIVRADDIGLAMARKGDLGLTRATGRWLVAAMPAFLQILMVVGTAAMLWVGGSILIHGAHSLGWSAPDEIIEHWAEAAAHGLPLSGGIQWLVSAACDFVVGIVIGLILMPIVAALSPILSRLFHKR